MTDRPEPPSGESCVILRRLADGETLQEIAGAHSVSARTVRRWIDNMRRHYGCDNRAALVALALRERWIE